MPRPQVKDLFERIGRPQIKPQASTDTFGYAQPANRSQSNDLTQLGGLMQKFSEAADSWADVLIEKEQKEGTEEGRAMALAAQRKGLNNLIKQSRNLPTGLNPFTVKAFHYNAGKLFAESPQTLAALNEGVSDWIAQSIHEQDLNADEISQKMDSEIIGPRLEGLINQLPDTAMARDLGFGESIQPILGKLKQSWIEDYESQVYTKNKEMFSSLVNQHLNSGDYEGAVDLYSPQTQDPESPDWNYAKAFGLGLDPREDKRKELFNTFRAHIEGEVVAPPNLGSVTVKSIGDAINRVDKMMAVRESGSNALVGKYAVEGQMPYVVLKRRLQSQLADALKTQETEDANQREKETTNLLNLIDLNQTAFLEALEKPINVKIPVQQEDGSWELATSQEVVDLGFIYDHDPLTLVTQFKTLLKDEKIKDANGNVVTEDSLGYVLKDVFNRSETIEGLGDSLTAIKKSADNRNLNAKERRAHYEKLMGEFKEDARKLLVNTLTDPKGKHGERWSDEEFNEAFDRMVETIVGERNNPFGIIHKELETRRELLEAVSAAFRGTHLDSIQGNDQFYNLVDEMLPRLMELDSWNLKRAFETNDDFRTVDPAVRKTVVEDLINKRSFLFDLRNFEKHEGAGLLLNIRKATIGMDANFGAALNKTTANTFFDPKDRVIFGRTIGEGRFIDQQKQILAEKNIAWREKITEVFKHFNYDSEAANDFLQSVTLSKSKDPIELPAIGDTPAKKFLDASPSVLMLQTIQDTENPVTGEKFKGWKDWLDHLEVLAARNRSK